MWRGTCRQKVVGGVERWSADEGNREAGHSDECRATILRKDNGWKQPTGGVTNTLQGRLRGELNRKWHRNRQKKTKKVLLGRCDLRKKVRRKARALTR